jgi:hypothetical protein
MNSQEWYAVLRHRRGNPDARFAVTCPYCRTLSTLPADGTLAFRAGVGVLKGWPASRSYRSQWERILDCRFPGRCVPGYHRLVPPGRKTLMQASGTMGALQPAQLHVGLSRSGPLM